MTGQARLAVAHQRRDDHTGFWSGGNRVRGSRCLARRPAGVVFQASTSC